jgi:hypothetical protein
MLLFISINPFSEQWSSINKPSSGKMIIEEPIAQSGGKNVSLYINATLSPSIQNEINTYVNDLTNDGYNVRVINWSDPSPTLFQRAINLRVHLNNSYNVNNTIGAALIGDMPYALFDGFGTIYSNHPVDLFFMDLDGNWTDTDFDQDFDIHNNGLGDIYPEIFIGRINANETTAMNPLQSLKDYFNRNHQYRLKNTYRSNNSLMYIDDPWESYSHEWVIDLQYLGTNVTLVNNTIETTDAPHFIPRIVKPFEFTHLFCHSDWNTHYFTNPANTLTNIMLKTLDTNSLFYNLYCCYAAKFDQVDNMASLYLFNSTHSLGVYGCSRSGGFQLNQYLYQPLSLGKSLGESLYNWFFNDVYDLIKTHGPSSPDSRGNLLLGDPFLRIRDPPPPSYITPPTFLTQSQTINQRNITIQWTTVPEASYYNIYIDGILNTSSTGNSKEIDLQRNGVYLIAMTSVNASGAESTFSSTISITVNITSAVPGYFMDSLLLALVIAGAFLFLKNRKRLKIK